jgi:cytoskeletal protein RodZ
VSAAARRAREFRQSSELCVITKMPVASAAATSASATPPTNPAAAAATGLSLRLSSMNWPAPQIPTEKAKVTPIPATTAAATVLSSSSVWTTVAIIRRPP